MTSASPPNQVEHAGKHSVRMALQEEIEKLPLEERAIVERFVRRKRVSRNVLRDFDDSRSFGERIADRVADIGGSWPFIFGFLGSLVAWMLFNSWLLAQRAFDPYPYILLNLVLSCVAAIQAPIIMMSQKRQNEADRRQAAHDYEVNIKAELEILQVHEKLTALRDSEVAQLLDKVTAMMDRLEHIEARLGEPPRELPPT